MKTTNERGLGKHRKLSLGLTTLVLFSLGTTAAQEKDSAATEGGEHELSRYIVKDLGTLGGRFSVANSINNKGWVTGQANLKGDKVGHAVLWRRGAKILDLGTLGGPKSGVFFPVKNDKGLIVGQSDTFNPDPLRENFCDFGTGLICRGFLWQHGAMVPLPTLGGNNSTAVGVNNRGEVVGTAEYGTPDSSCIAPQVLHWGAVIWGPNEGEIRKLPPLSGDSVAAAVAINDKGQVVGGSGICMSIYLNWSQHAVLWQDGSVTDLGSFGGAVNNFSNAINNRGQVVGVSDLPGDKTYHAFLWTNEDGIQDLGTLPGDFLSGAFGINNQGQVVGLSCDTTGKCRAFLWQDGVMTDLNTLVCHGSSLFLAYAGDINDRGEIAGLAVTTSGETPAFLAVPTEGDGECEPDSSATPNVIIPEDIREQLRQRMRLRPFGAWPARPQ